MQSSKLYIIFSRLQYQQLCLIRFPAHYVPNEIVVVIMNVCRRCIPIYYSGITKKIFCEVDASQRLV